MKNIEKHINCIAKLVDKYMICHDCPCHNECFNYDSATYNVIGCKEFFKRWALEEADDGEKD